MDLNGYFDEKAIISANINGKTDDLNGKYDGFERIF